ncbi:MAG: LysR family transcriptional regulator, partial [Okeania sp. SIO2D1]|nr:LysR family transcriptional regulator [Okeania sp. SIO2D1]
VKEQFERLGAKLNAALELNTLDAFRGVVRQGNLIALLPHSALIDVKLDPTLAIKTIGVTPTTSKVSSIKDSVWSREVVVVTTSDRIQIPPIEYFWELVKELIPQQINQTTTTTKQIAN